MIPKSVSGTSLIVALGAVLAWRGVDMAGVGVGGTIINQGGIMEFTPEQIAAENEAWAFYIERRKAMAEE